MAQTKIVFLVLPHVHLIDLAGPLQVFHEAIDFGTDVSIEYCSFETEGMPTSSKFPLGPLKSFNQITLRSGDYLFIPGAEVDFLISRRLSSEKELIRWVTDAHASGAFICSICTGAFFVARTGLLNGRKCTSHWKRTAQLQEKFPGIKVVEDVLFTEDEGIYTSAGVTAGIDMALFILSKITDESVSYKVARELVVYLRRNGSDSQQSVFMKYRNHVHAGIHNVQDFVHENIQRKTSLVQLADKACMSTRTLTRTFRKETGITVNEYTTLIRKETLKHLMKNPDLSRKQMARLCGLKSERQVIRLLQTL